MSAGPFLLQCSRRPFHGIQTTSTYLTEQHRLNFFQFLCLSHSSAIFPPLIPPLLFCFVPIIFFTSSHLLYISAHCSLSRSLFSPCTGLLLSFGPGANMVHYIFNVVCNCLALSTCQEQIMFQSVCLRLVYWDLNQPSTSVALNSVLSSTLTISTSYHFS